MKTLYLYVLVQILCSCNKTNQESNNRYTTKGETAEVLKEQYNDPSPHYELLGTPIAGSSKKLLKVFICKARWSDPQQNEDENMKQLKIFKNWILGDEGYHGFLKGAEFKDESTKDSLDQKVRLKWTFKKQNGPEIGGDKIANDWVVEINDNCQNIGNEYQVVILNGNASAITSNFPFEDKNDMPYSVTLLNECGTEGGYETTVSNLYVRRNAKFGLVSSRNWIYLINFANSNANLLIGLSRGQKWSEIISRMNSANITPSKKSSAPLYVVRTSEIHVGLIEKAKLECNKLSGDSSSNLSCDVDPNMLNELQCFEKNGSKRYANDKKNKFYETTGKDIGEETRKEYPTYIKCRISLNRLSDS